MDVKELRIGNIVNSVFTNEPETIDLWALNKIANGNSQNSYCPHLKVFEPIPLTEEWLIKFGALEVPTKSDLRFILNDSVLDVFQDGFSKDLSFRFVLKSGINFNGVSFPINYVHQLQNLYFALTNTELTLK